MSAVGYALGVSIAHYCTPLSHASRRGGLCGRRRAIARATAAVASSGAQGARTHGGSWRFPPGCACLSRAFSSGVRALARAFSPGARVPVSARHNVFPRGKRGTQTARNAIAPEENGFVTSLKDIPRRCESAPRESKRPLSRQRSRTPRTMRNRAHGPTQHDRCARKHRCISRLTESC